MRRSARRSHAWRVGGDRRRPPPPGTDAAPGAARQRVRPPVRRVGRRGLIVAPEPYGVVTEETATYLRLDGETRRTPTTRSRAGARSVELAAGRAGTIDGIGRWSYDGTELPVTADDLTHAQITTRDIDRWTFPHFLLKEITGAPGSFRKTLRGQAHRVGRPVRRRAARGLAARRGPSTAGRRQVTRVLVIGQGTAAVAGQSLAEHLRELLADTEVRAEALPATELSGFRLRADMSTRWPSRSASRAPPPTPTAPSTCFGAGSVGGGDRQPTQLGPDRQRPTASSTPPTDATWR